MNRLIDALANAADGAFVIDKNQYIIFWNKAAEEVLEYAADEVIGQPCHEIMDGRDEQGRLICREYCRAAVTGLTGSAVTSFDLRARTQSGDSQWVNLSTFTFPANENGSDRLLVHLFREVTQRKQYEQFVEKVLGAVKHLQNRGLHPPFPPEQTEHSFTDLTNREREVLSLLAQGLSTRDIARSLSISPSTVRNHIRNILHKLGVHSRLEAVVYAFEHGLVSNN